MQQRVAVWGTGNMGSTAIRSALAFPGLALSGVITSSPDQSGHGRGRVRRPGQPDRGGGDDGRRRRTGRLRRRRLHGVGRHPSRRGRRRHRAVPACGQPCRHAVAVLALRPPLGAAGMGRAAHRGRRGGRVDPAGQRRRPGLGQRCARGDRRRPVHPDPVHPLPGDLRLLDLQPAARGEGVVRFRRLDGRGLR